MIAKCDPTGRETRLYEQMAPREPLPVPRPRSRWGGDPVLIAALVRLHSSTRGIDLNPLQPFLPQ